MLANISSTTLGPNNGMLQLDGGDCKSKNIIYSCQYSLCDKFLFGKTIQTLANRHVCCVLIGWCGTCDMGTMS